jgi:hypothetical protein
MGEKIVGGVERKKAFELFKGSIMELLDDSFHKVGANVSDINTDAEAVRGITLSIIIKPTSDRKHWQLKLRVREKLAPYPDIDGFIVAQYREDGMLLSEDAGNQLEMDYETVLMTKVEGDKKEK